MPFFLAPRAYSPARAEGETERGAEWNEVSDPPLELEVGGPESDHKPHLGSRIRPQRCTSPSHASRSETTRPRTTPRRGPRLRPPLGPPACPTQTSGRPATRRHTSARLGKSRRRGREPCRLPSLRHTAACLRRQWTPCRASCRISRTPVGRSEREGGMAEEVSETPGDAGRETRPALTS